MTVPRSSPLSLELEKSGLVGHEGLEQAHEVSEANGIPLDQALFDLRLVAEDKLLEFLSERYHVPLVDLHQAPLDSRMAELIPRWVAQQFLAVPLYRRGQTIVCAMAEAWNVTCVDEMRFAIGHEVKPVLATREAIREKLREFYPTAGEDEPSIDRGAVLEEALQDIQDRNGEGGGETKTEQRLRHESTSSPIVKIVNDILIRAISKGASDIHIEPQENALGVRYRIDGSLHQIMRLPKKVQAAVISRVKVLAGMDISVSRKPQDGRIKLHYRDKPLDLRVSTLPTYWGEKVVMRLLDQSGLSLELEKLGFLPGDREKVEEIMRQPQGMLLVTGPTGSGKTTTLYSVLSAINHEDINIITVEDPVEYQLANISQVPVNPKAGMSFAAGLRSILRQDPNVIMVGEIRDQETAEIALEAAETGHMVFSTLHTNSAAGAVTRFLDMEVPAYLLASSLSGVLAQRLLRRNCPHCLAEVEVADATRRKYRIPSKVTFYEGQGCSHCEGRGKKGRIGVYEMIVADEAVREGIYEGVSEAELVDRSRRGGTLLMFEDALIKAMRGEVAPTEMLMNVEPPAGTDIDGGRLLEQAESPWEQRGVHAPRSDPAKRVHPRALVVGGSQSVRNLIRLVLQAEGMAVAATASGRRGLDFIHQRVPDLVVADGQVEELDAVSLTRAVRNSPGLQNVAILLLGEAGATRAEGEAIGAGADDFIFKPLEPERLIVRARRALEDQADRRRLRHAARD